MKKVLFATDFSESSQNALDFLKDMVSGLDVSIHLTNVYNIPVTYTASIPYKAIQGMIDEKEEATIRRLNELREEIAEGQRGKLYPIFGIYPSTEISELAEERGFDLVVMAHREKYGLMDKMIGSVTAHAMLKTSVPLLSIPNGAKYNSINDILFPTEMDVDTDIKKSDFSSLEKLIDFCDLLSSPNIHMLHVSKEASPSAIDLSFKNFPFKGVDFTVSASKNVDEGILSYLEKGDTDLIAMYKPHRSLWERLYHSSVTSKMLYKSQLPLLIFP